MKKSKRLTALFAAVLMAITMFTGATSAFAADSKTPVRVGTDSYSSLKITGWRSINSTSQMYAQTTSNKTAYRLSATIVGKAVDSKGNSVRTGGSPDKSKDNTTASPVASITKGNGTKLTYVYILYAGLYDNNLDHCASTQYDVTFWVE